MKELRSYNSSTLTSIYQASSKIESDRLSVTKIINTRKFILSANWFKKNMVDGGFVE